LNGRIPLGAALFFLLVAASLATSVLVVRARTPDLVLEVLRPRVDQRVVFGPGTGSPRVTIEFFVRESDPHALVGIVDRHEDIVRTLDGDVALSADEPALYRWDGSADGGGTAAPGRYRLLVELPAQDREMVFPRRFTFDPGSPG
jgi:hypothetical protein